MQKISILLEASQAILSTFDLDEVLQRILSLLREHFGVQNLAILLLDQKAQELYVRSHSGWDPAHESIRLPLGVGLTGIAAATRQPVYSPDVRKDARYICSVASTRSELALPLVVQERVVGVLDCQSDQEDFFSQEAIDLLRVFSSQASIAIQNAGLYTSEQRRAAQLEAINAIARQSTAVLELDELLRTVCQLILQAFPVDHVTVLLLEEGKLVLRASAGQLTPEQSAPTELAPGVGLSFRALQTGEPVIANDVHEVGAYVHGLKETRSEMCVPLVAFGNTLGVLVLDSARAAAFTAEDVAPLEAVADMCATAIQNAHYVEKVKQLAYLDGLTGVFNRRHFEMRIHEELERWVRYKSEFAVVLVDIDHFKKVNDEFGHLLGDEVLRQISRLFAQQLRKPDVLCRYGGEEFALLLPEASAQRAQAVAEKLRRAMERWPFPGVPWPVTMSAGLAACPGHGHSRDELVQTADAALYAAKQAGRNRVVVAPAAKGAGEP